MSIFVNSALLSFNCHLKLYQLLGIYCIIFHDSIDLYRLQTTKSDSSKQTGHDLSKSNPCYALLVTRFPPQSCNKELSPKMLRRPPSLPPTPPRPLAPPPLPHLLTITSPILLHLRYKTCYQPHGYAGLQTTPSIPSKDTLPADRGFSVVDLGDLINSPDFHPHLAPQAIINALFVFMIQHTPILAQPIPQPAASLSHPRTFDHPSNPSPSSSTIPLCPT